MSELGGRRKQKLRFHSIFDVMAAASNRLVSLMTSTSLFVHLIYRERYEFRNEYPTVQRRAAFPSHCGRIPESTNFVVIATREAKHTRFLERTTSCFDAQRLSKDFHVDVETRSRPAFKPTNAL